ncbi:AAA family ATPase [Maricaulaceae bacterium MS644]
MNRQTADAFEDFDADDDFLDASEDAPEDPFLDAEAVERRLLGEEDAPRRPAQAEDVHRPFGARLAEANASDGDSDPFGDAGYDDEAYETRRPPRPPHPAARGPAARAQAPSRRQARVDDPFGDADDFEESDPFEDARPKSARFEPETVISGGDYGEVEGLSEGDDSLLTQPVPRIAIHAFCESPDTGQLIHRAGTDRRLQKAHVTVELGGLAAAIERFHDESTPELLIIETGMRGRELFQQLDELATVCDGDTKVIIVGAANDIALYRELMRRGVSEYLVPPMTPLHVIKTISGLFLDPEQPFAGKSLCFVGAKGGVGSSTIAHNVAWHLTESLRTDAVLVDLDLSFGTAGLDFNQDPPQTIAEALAQPDRLDQALLDRLLVRCTERLSLFSAPSSLESDWDFQPEHFETVLEVVRRQAPFVALDLPHAWSPWVRRTILSADQVVVTVTPDLACLRNAKNLFDLVRQKRPNDEPPRIVVNMAGCPKKPDIPLKDFSDALGAAPVLVLPFEPALFGKAANNGQMIAEVDPKSKAAEGFAHLAGLLTGRAAPAAKSKSLFGSLFGKK